MSDTTTITDDDMKRMQEIAADLHGRDAVRLLQDALDGKPQWRPQARAMLAMIYAGRPPENHHA